MDIGRKRIDRTLFVITLPGYSNLIHFGVRYVLSFKSFRETLNGVKLLKPLKHKEGKYKRIVILFIIKPKPTNHEKTFQRRVFKHFSIDRSFLIENCSRRFTHTTWLYEAAKLQ